MNQNSCIGFGVDATVLAGYAQRANDRLGAFSVLVENTGVNPLYLQFKEYDGVTAPSGWFNVGSAITVAPQGLSQPQNFVLVTKKLGFFGSGNTTANISTVIHNKSDLRGAQIDIVAGGRRGWGFDQGFDTGSFVAGWGPAPDGNQTTDVAPGEEPTGIVPLD